MDSHSSVDAITDMMHRRTPLPFCGRFLWLGSSVTIQTDSQAVLRAAEGMGFLPHGDLEQESQIRWEIVTEPTSTPQASDCKCKVTIDNHSLFLSMGAGQWFAFDFESGDGAGFVVIPNPGASTDANAVKYLSEIACQVGNCLQPASDRSRWL